MRAARRSTCRNPRPSRFPISSARASSNRSAICPGAKEYLADLTDSAKQVAVYNGQLMGLPYFSTVWVWNYFTDLMEKAKFEPFKTYDELLEQLRKAKQDKIAE